MRKKTKKNFGSDEIWDYTPKIQKREDIKGESLYEGAKKVYLTIFHKKK